MNKELRKKTILAMELLVRSVNNEEYLDSWLMCGVPDGDIKNYKLEEVDENLIENNNFAEIITLFLKIMSKAYKDGSLYIDEITGE